MPIFDKATGRVVAVIVLLIVIAAALRGYLPGVERADPQPPHSGASLVYVATLLSVSLVIVAVALIARLRDPRRVASSASPLPRTFSDGTGRPGWRVLLIGAAVLLVWLALAWLLSHFIGPHQIDQPQSPSSATVSAATGKGPQRPGPQDNGADGDMLRYLIAGSVTLLAMIVAGAVVAAGTVVLGSPIRAWLRPNRSANRPPSPRRPHRWCGRRKAGWPRSKIPITSHGRRSSRATRPWNASCDVTPARHRRTSTLPQRFWPAPSNTTRCTSITRPNW